MDVITEVQSLNTQEGLFLCGSVCHHSGENRQTKEEEVHGAFPVGDNRQGSQCTLKGTVCEMSRVYASIMSETLNIQHLKSD